LTPADPHEMVTVAADARKRKPHILVAAGGDGAVNLVARTLIGSPARLGILPLGRFNNIFSSLIGKPSVSLALSALGDNYRSIDCGKVSEQPFFGSIGLGLIPALAESLAAKSTPRFALSWSRLAASAVAGIERSRMPVRVDSYRFDLEPAVISVHLLPRNFGLTFAPSALLNDQRFEVTLDMSVDSEPLSKFVREVYKGSHHFDGDLRMYRAEEISIGGVKGQKLYLDGELIDVPTNTLEIKFYSKQLRVCTPQEN
jgi:diacylglycerol kinase family enzyme